MDWIAAAAEPFDGHGGAAPTELKLPFGSIGLQPMASGVGDPEQSIRAIMQIKVRTGDHEARRAVFGANPAEPRERPAIGIAANHLTIPGVRRENVTAARRHGSQKHPLPQRFAFQELPA